jgi:DNA-binding NarL/FixJ family response regulator
MPTVLGAKFEDLVAIGLRVLISEDPHLELLADAVEMDGVEAAIERHRPDVVLLNYGTLGSPGRVLQLHRS